MRMGDSSSFIDTDALSGSFEETSTLNGDISQDKVSIEGSIDGVGSITGTVYNRSVVLNGSLKDKDSMFGKITRTEKLSGSLGKTVSFFRELPIATTTSLGAVIVGDNLSVEPDGTLSADAEEIDPISNIEIERMLGGL